MSDSGRKPANERTAEMAPHYQHRKAQQHWDRMWDLYREAWFVGNVTKYVERYRGKNGLADLYKARHYLDKLIELEESDATQRVSAAGTGEGGRSGADPQPSNGDGRADEPPGERSARPVQRGR